ncbi:Transposable element Tcb2 transposase [Rhizoctonia solani]|uniref:Transposable element Tcb2 transposase n=1 Tax=Rhizoctonia solani TaxID=456999 RepID=A0A8H8NNN5_9AGAM|nr:Transposable element Tcb2 transposase [Rhizoctonia solani]QRW15696.1 Transposable element Tcb2 transposase [Rhizoctonia solani]
MSGGEAHDIRDDMNIIENIWNYLDCQVHSSDPALHNVAELWEALQEEWACINPIIINKLYESMPD